MTGDIAEGQPLHPNVLLVLTETWLELEPIIDQVAKSVCGGTDVSYDGLVDYEVTFAFFLLKLWGWFRVSRT